MCHHHQSTSGRLRWFQCVVDQFCVCMCAGGESACGAHAVGAAGDGLTAAAADRGSAADACRKGSVLYIAMNCILMIFHSKCVLLLLNYYLEIVWKWSWPVTSNH